LSIEAVAQACGFHSALSLRKHFQRVVRMSPTVYRAQFNNRAECVVT
jgi:transcriptional regulator GlxA family with amidase domain